MISIYKTIPLITEAIEWTGDNFEEIKNFMGLYPGINYTTRKISIETLQGVMFASEGDMIIKGVKGGFYPCKRDIFEMTYSAENKE